jgi:hypothetical protein
MWWEGGDGIGMGWDGEGRISVWRSGRKERVFSSGTDKSMIYQPTFVDSIEADAYRTGQDRTGVIDCYGTHVGGTVLSVCCCYYLLLVLVLKLELELSLTATAHQQAADERDFALLPQCSQARQAMPCHAILRCLETRPRHRPDLAYERPESRSVPCPAQPMLECRPTPANASANRLMAHAEMRQSWPRRTSASWQALVLRIQSTLLPHTLFQL